MFQGTGSDVGKSLLVAGLCRAFMRRGLKVRPFKPQNMSNNAAVCDGGEIGRAQALQALAAGVTPFVHMNPVLLKPQSEMGAQVVVQGKIEGVFQARDYHELKQSLMERVLESFKKTADGADLVLIEGAGSAAEVNLREFDIANMGFAEAAKVPVVLIGDIDRGGVIASIIGTNALLSDAEKSLIKGFVINKFRGDASLFDDAVHLMEEGTGFQCFGVVPFFAKASALPQEDSMALDSKALKERDKPIKIAVPRLSRIANFDDLDPLAAEEDVSVDIINQGQPLPGDAHLIVLPGTKASAFDLSYIREQGWDIDILAHKRRGGMVVGLCGGYQILGRILDDASGVEGAPARAKGLGLLDVETTIEKEKTLCEVRGREVASSEEVKGYEMHMGQTTGDDQKRPWIVLEDGREEGAVSQDGLVMGSYIHGLFAADGFRHAFLSRLREGRAKGTSYDAMIEETLDALAAHLEAHMDLDKILAAAGPV
jgi:adenosylcobyric acid synthase